MIGGLYFIQQVLSIDDNRSSIFNVLTSQETGPIIFSSSAVVCFLLNIGCFIYETVSTKTSFPFLKVGVFFVLELFTIQIITKKTMTSTRLGMRCLTNYGICNILLFVHKLGDCFIVSMYFIALAPAPTIAAIVLCFSSIMMIIIATAFMLIIGYTGCFIQKRYCITIFKIVMLIIFIICALTIIVLFTLIFVDLTAHGLIGSNMGSIIFSLAVPIMTLLLSIVIERQLKKKSRDSQPQNSGYENIQGNINA